MNYQNFLRLRAVVYGLLLLPIFALAQPAYAACTPIATPGQPPAGTTVTCSGTTTNQNGNVGYGDGSQTGLTIDVLNGATVAGTNNGIDLGLGPTNTINNAGTITDTGTNPAFVFGINTSGSIDLTNNLTGVISLATTSPNGGGAFAVNPSTSLIGSNAGLISASSNANEATAAQSNAINFVNTGTISASGSNQIGTFGIFGVNSLVLTNSGTVSADGGTGTTGTAVESAGTLDVTNLAGGVIQGTETNTTSASVGVFAGGSGGTNDQATIGNAGTIHGDDFGIISFSDTSTTITNSGMLTGGIRAIVVVGSGASNITNSASGVISATGPGANNDAINTSGATTIDNSGMISSTGRSGVRVGSNASITNESGATITGVAGIVFRDPTATNTPVVNGSVFNAGTITGTGGTAINFALTPGSGPMTLTLGPGSVINGKVLGTGSDTLNLGGVGSDTFNVSQIGVAQQYQGFSAFNKIGTSTWTLTGTGAQAWSIVSGTLIGDTNSLGAATYPVSAGATLEFKQNFDGTYAGIVTGLGGLAKDGTGIVTLTNDNTYTGGTTISAGTLQLGNGGTAGSIVGDVVDNSSLAFDRSNTVTFNGVISGSGDVHQIGVGTLTFTAASSYAGNTLIDAGSTLALNGSGSIVNARVTTNGTFDISTAAGSTSIRSLDGTGTVTLGATSLTLTMAAGDFGGVISGTGGLVVSGGSETLSGANTYSGGTTISAGTLQLGNGGTAGSIVGDVVDNSSLAFDRSNAVTFVGAISGSGNLKQIGSGTTILTGANTYSGGTTTLGGTLQIGNGGMTGSITGDVIDNGTFGIDRSDDVTFSGQISGSGAFVQSGTNQSGTNTTTFLAAQTYTGGTTVAAGILQLGDATHTSGLKGAVTIDSGFDLSIVNADFSGVTSVDVIGGAVSLHLTSSLSTAQVVLEPPGASSSKLFFLDNSTAGNASITGTGDLITFLSNSTAGQASITNTDGQISFISSSSAGSSTIKLNSLVGGSNPALQFNETSTAGSATITSDQEEINFVQNSDAGSANISITDSGNNGFGTVVFFDNASAKNATLNASNFGSVFFETNTTADHSTINVGVNGFAEFDSSSTAANATVAVTGDGTAPLNFIFDSIQGRFLPNFTSTGGAVEFFSTTTAANASFDLKNGGSVLFANSSSAGSASFTVENLSVLAFTGGLVSGTSAGNATLTVQSGGTVLFANTASGATANIITQAGATVDISDLINGGTTLASVNGGGNVLLGANTLIIGGTGANSSIGGSVSGNGGGIDKKGAGELALLGTFSYTGTTTIEAGTLRLGGGTNSLSGNIVDNGSLITQATLLTLSGTVGGTGGLTVAGGTTILAVNDSYAGGTTISAGTLQLGNGGTAGSIVGDVLDNGSLAFDHSDSLTFSGAVSGSGSVGQIGSGTTILSGTNTYTGPTAVSSGTLDVNGSIANSAVTVNSGATLKGQGTVGSVTLAAGSIVAPGNSIGTLHVAGNVTFASGSIYQVELNPAGMADLIDATGTATISQGATVQVIAAPGTYQRGTTYKIVSAAGGVSGTFGGFSLNTASLIGRLVYSATFVDLVLSPADIDFAPLTHTRNEVATGAAVKAAGPQGTIFGAFLALQPDTAFITGALDQLSGEIHPSLETSELEDNQVVRQSILNRLRQSTAGDGSGLLAPSAAQARTIVDGLTMWTHVFAETGSVDSDGNAAEIRQNESGILAGIDAALGSNVTLGIGGGYTHSHLNQRTSSSSGGNDYLIASGGWSDGPFAFRAGGSYAWGDRNVTRHVSFPGFAETLTSKPNEHASQIFGEAAYSGRMSELAIEPFAGITWTDAATAAFSETGGTAALSGRGGDTSLAYSSLGLRLAANPIGGGDLALTPRAALAWQHAFGSLRPQQIVTFEDTHRSFLVLGTAIDADMANVDVGLDAKIGDGGHLVIGYEGILSSRVRLNTLHAGLNWTF